jgi:ankyrin repeat protein
MNELLFAIATLGKDNVFHILTTDSRFDINAVDPDDNFTPLLKALHYNPSDTDLIMDILEAKANVNISTDDTSPLIECITKHADIKILKRLLTLGANPNYQPKNNKKTALMYASSTDNSSDAVAVKLLLNHKANPLLIDSKGRTALMATRSLPILKALLNADSTNINAQDNTGHTALFYIASLQTKQTLEMAKLLVFSNSDVNIYNNAHRKASDMAKDPATKRYIEEVELYATRMPSPRPLKRSRSNSRDGCWPGYEQYTKGSCRRKKKKNNRKQ